jgi:hypothetical protein
MQRETEDMRWANDGMRWANERIWLTNEGNQEAKEEMQ